jgi:hypothetical protein
MSLGGRRSMNPYAEFHPLFILPCTRQPIGHGTSCPHHAQVIPGHGQRGAQVLPFSHRWLAK